MNTPTRIAAFGLALVAMLGAGAAAGAVVGPARPVRESTTMTDMNDTVVMPNGEGVTAATEGYRLVPAGSDLPAGGGTFSFVIRDRAERPVVKFVATHERELHLILVNRELTSYHHLHPVLAADGTWSVPVPALDPGSYRAVADFRVADGPALALGVDVAVAGTYQPSTVPGRSGLSSIDGYDVEIATAPAHDGETNVALTVRRGGMPVTDLQPYLGASGHLVAMRLGDLAYAHVHPLSYADGTVRFAATLPSAGRYRLFFDFRHGDVVHTASFTYDQGPVAASTRPPEH